MHTLYPAETAGIRLLSGRQGQLRRRPCGSRERAGRISGGPHWRAENRAFLGRAVQYLTAEAGVRQFLDIGSGLPTTNDVHEVAQAVAPSSRAIYVDNDRCKSGCAHAVNGCLALARVQAWSSGSSPRSQAVNPAPERGAGQSHGPCDCLLTQPRSTIVTPGLHGPRDERALARPSLARELTASVLGEILDSN